MEFVGINSSYIPHLPRKPFPAQFWQPSLFDSNPNTIREALNFRCIPLTTNNIGFNEQFPETLICKTYNYDEWLNKIIFLLNNFNITKNYEITFKSELNIDNFIDNINKYFDNKNISEKIKNELIEKYMKKYKKKIKIIDKLKKYLFNNFSPLLNFIIYINI